jgi:hypothetical protein
MSDQEDIAERVRYISLDECETDEEYEEKMEQLRDAAEWYSDMEREG